MTPSVIRRMRESSSSVSGSASSISKISYATIVPETLPSPGLNRPRRLAPLGNGRRDGEAGSDGECSIAAMKRPLAWLLGGFAASRFFRKRRPAASEPPDPRAEQLRQRLAEARELVQ